MNNNVEKYLKDVCSFIKNKEVHEEISCEIREHVYDIVDEYMEDGLDESEAINKAISRMGSAEDCGVKLNKIHKAEPDYTSIALTGVLVIITLITMISLYINNLATSSVINNILGLIIGSDLAFGLYIFDYRKIKKYSYLIYCISNIVLLLNAFNLLGMGMLGYSSNTNFIKLMIVLALLISISGIINIKEISTVIEFVKFICIAMVPCLFLLFSYSHYRPYGIYLCMVYICGLNIVFFISKTKKSFKLIFSLLEVSFFSIISAYLKKIPYIIALVTSTINPSADPNGNGYIAMNIRNALGNSNLLGNKLDYDIVRRIPLLDNNSTLTYIVYRFGIIAGVISILVLIAFIIRLFSLKRTVKDSYGKSIISLISVVLLVQVIFSVLGNLGLISLSFTLPFISSGIMNFIVNISLVGLVSSVYRRRNLLIHN